MQPKISVIIPVFNVEKYLKECLESVVNQTLRDIEIICVDDGSTDNSLKILEEYKAKDKRITVIKQNNLYAGVARNSGLAVAKGKFVIFFDADDIMDNLCLNTLYSNAEKNNTDITICKSKLLQNDTKEISICEYAINDRLINNRKIFAPQDFADNIFQFCVGWPWDKLYKREFIVNHNLKFQNLRHSNDTYFVLSSLCLAEKISIVDNLLVIHRLHSASLEHTRMKEPSCFYYALMELYKFLKKSNLYSLYQRSFINYCITFSSWHLMTIEDAKSKKIILKYISNLFKDLKIKKYPDNYFYDIYTKDRLLDLQRNFFLRIISPFFHITKFKNKKKISILGIKITTH